MGEASESVTAGFIGTVVDRQRRLWDRFEENLARAPAAMAQAEKEPVVEDSTGLVDCVSVQPSASAQASEGAGLPRAQAVIASIK